MTAYLILTYLAIFLYGIIIGSFLNVCILRIPRQENIVTAPSHCMACGYSLRWYDLIPLFSYLCLKGRCRCCKAKISVQYPLVEFLNGFLYIAVFHINGLNCLSLVFCLLTSALLAISIIDFRTLIIPFGMNLFIFGLGIVRVLLDLSNWLSYLLGSVLVSAFLLLLFFATKGRGIGGGDIKLMAASGLVLGWQKIALAFFIGCIVGSVIHSVRMRISKESHVLAMSPYLSVGIWLALFFGDAMIRWYLGMVRM